MRIKHSVLVEKIMKEFYEKGFIVKTEIKLPNGKGAVDIVAEKNNLKIYIEAKSSPQSINSKKVQKQLGRYKESFGEGGVYCLISPNSARQPKICSLDKKINCSLKNYLN
jgi:Holliday junction resolvase